MIYKFKIPLKPRQKKNGRPIFINKKTGKHFIGKDKSLKDYESNCFMILSAQKNIQGIKAPIEKEVILRCTFEFIKLCRGDGDGLQTGLQDLIQSAGILQNDKQIKKWIGEVKENTGREQTVFEIEIPETEKSSNVTLIIQSILNK